MRKNKFKSSKFHKIIFTISLFVVLFIGAITYKHIDDVSTSSKQIMHTYEVNLELERLFSYIKDSENSMRGFLITNESIYLNPYYTANSNINQSFSTLKKLTSDNKKQQKNLNELYEIIKKRLDYNGQYSDPDVSKHIEDTKKFKKDFFKSSKLLVAIRNKINEMADLESSYLKKRNSLYNEQISFTPVLTLSILFITILLIVYSYYKTNKDLERLKEINNSLNKSIFLNSQAEILSSFGTWEWNLITHVTTYSDNFYRILGYEPHSFPSTNDNFLTFVHPEDKEIVLEIMSKVVKEENLPPSTFRIIRSDGEIRFFRATGKLFDEKLKSKTVLGVTHDITDEINNNLLLKKNIEDLKKVNNELEIFDESSKQAEILGNYGSWVLNFENNKFIYSDNNFRLMGYEPQSFEPTIENLLLHVHEEDKEIVIEANEAALSNDEIPTMNYRIIRKDGEVRRFKTVAKSFIDLSGEESIIGTTQDVTEDYYKSKLLKERNLELEQNIKELNEFNHVASHDLQEPLRKIQTFISRLNDKEKENLSDFGKDYLSRIQRASDRMRILINDLLQYSRTNRGDKNFNNVDLNEVLANSLLELSQNIEDRKANIQYDSLQVIKGVEFQMQQLFTNLISNSLKYSKENEVPKIVIKYKKVKAKNEAILKDNSNRVYHRIRFKDNGIGFEQENAEKIFLLFNRLHGKTEYQGTGVGLAICKKIVENHNGYIFASSEPNKGSIFTIYIPKS
ncbi:PAS domain-containing protein [Flavobacterium jejuense]|uniref:histidine kinase n=1 Tax=Flavobacterium jejuense TaxID=1544455 RepID=A0ABX0ISR0_9FLAO|nr:PAS domain-containing protein [Flavobacterium jejuense]NHN26902.1 PAS domain-containing protein [Flavobacterium jejuense]